MRIVRNELPPRDDADDREIDRDVDQRHHDRADQNRPWDHSARILHFVADVADVVVAEVVVRAHARRRAEAEQEAEREVEGAGREVEGNFGVEVHRPCRDHDDDGHDRADPERDRDRRDRLDPAVEQRKVDETDDRDHEHRLARRDPLPDVTQVVRKPDVSGCDLEGPAQYELPYKEKGHQAAGFLRPVALAQVGERAARARHRGTELAPDGAVAQDGDQRDGPAEHRLRAAERRHEQRDRDERPDPDHVRHVERRGVQQAEAAREAGCCVRWRAYASS